MVDFVNKLTIDCGITFYDSIQNQFYIVQDDLALPYDVISGTSKAELGTWYGVPVIQWLENVKTKDTGIIHLF